MRIQSINQFISNSSRRDALYLCAFSKYKRRVVDTGAFTTVVYVFRILFPTLSPSAVVLSLACERIAKNQNRQP